MPDWMSFVLILVGILCTTVIILVIVVGRRDLNKFNQELPKLPSIQKDSDDDQNHP